MTVPRMTGTRRVSGRSLLPSAVAPTAPDAASLRPPSHAHWRFSRHHSRTDHVREPGRAVRFLLSLITAMLAVSFWAISRMSPRLAGAEVSFFEPAGEGWVRQQTPAPKRANSSRSLILYQPSATMANCRMDFQWKADATGVGVIVRSHDPRNYQAARLKTVSGGIVEERFNVINGLEAQHSIKTITFPNQNAELAVAVEVMGPKVALYLQDELADSWNDPKVEAGSVGFFEDRKMQAQARMIRISFADGSVTRTADSVFRGVLQAARGWWESFRISLIL
jgi:hypothetical protein